MDASPLTAGGRVVPIAVFAWLLTWDAIEGRRRLTARRLAIAAALCGLIAAVLKVV